MTDELAKKISEAELRQFGLLFSLVLLGLFGLALPWLVGASWPVWPWLVAGIMATLSVAWARALGPVYRVWMRFGLIAGFINTRIIMFLLYYGVFVPVALLMRLTGRDALARQVRNKDVASYRVTSARRPKDHFERPY